MLFLREIKVLEARQRLEALVIPKRQVLTRLQELLAPSMHVTQMAFPQQLKTSIFRLFGYTIKVQSCFSLLAALSQAALCALLALACSQLFLRFFSNRSHRSFRFCRGCRICDVVFDVLIK
jgi:Pyruvate/2-oxoacid:ferredoxin oxidoreductase delta subunit